MAGPGRAAATPEADAMVECPNCAFRNAESDGFCGSCGVFLWPAVAGAKGAGAGAGAVGAADVPAEGPAGRVATIPAGRRADGSTGAAVVACRSCGRPNLASRKFCGRCGTTLARQSSYVAEQPPSALARDDPWWRERWWRRLFWWRRRRALPVFRAGTRPGARVDRGPADLDGNLAARLAPNKEHVRWVRKTVIRIWPDVLLWLLILLLIALLFPDARRKAWEANPFRKEPAGFLAPRFCSEPAAQGESLTDYPPAFACDRKKETFWATGVTKIAPSAMRTALWIDFPTKVNVRAFHITAAEPSAAELLSSAVLKVSGRPAQVCVKFFISPDKRTEYYSRLGAGHLPDRMQPEGSRSIPRPEGDALDSFACSNLTPDGVTIDNNAKEHRFSFETVKDIGAASVEIRRVYPAGLDQQAVNVFVSGIEFYGEEARDDAEASVKKPNLRARLPMPRGT